MYRVLIVDDDEIIRAGMEKSINWEDNGFSICGVAENGMEGIAAARIYKPHIIITDIEMPFMDGLEMTRLINEEFPLIKIILLTDYDNFEYAKKAINLKVTDYLLKYSESEEILNAIIKAKEELIKEKEVAEKEVKGKIPMQNKFLRELITGIGSEETNQEEAKLLDIKFKGNKFCLAVLKIDDYKAWSIENNAACLELAVFSILNICEEILAESNGMAFSSSYQGVNILFNFSQSETNAMDSISPLLENIKKSIEKFLKIHVVIGVGNVYSGYKNIPLSNNEAMLAVEMKDVLKKAESSI